MGISGCAHAQALHNAGVVHRDVKPLNLVLAERERRFKLIDLGAGRRPAQTAPTTPRTRVSWTPPTARPSSARPACAPARMMRQIPGSSRSASSAMLLRFCKAILPPASVTGCLIRGHKWCRYCLPTTAPDLSSTLAPLKLAISPLLWSRHKPDCFDSYSCGLVLMQLAVPKLRSAAALRTFSKALQVTSLYFYCMSHPLHCCLSVKRACRVSCIHACSTAPAAGQSVTCNLDGWRERERLPAAQLAALDAESGAGWDLAKALLRPRKLQVRHGAPVARQCLQPQPASGPQQFVTTHRQVHSSEAAFTLAGEGGQRRGVCQRGQGRAPSRVCRPQAPLPQAGARPSPAHGC